MACRKVSPGKLSSGHVFITHSAMPPTRHFSPSATASHCFANDVVCKDTHRKPYLQPLREGRARLNELKARLVSTGKVTELIVTADNTITLTLVIQVRGRAAVPNGLYRPTSTHRAVTPKSRNAFPKCRAGRRCCRAQSARIQLIP
jgi:hypothetical protein